MNRIVVDQKSETVQISHLHNRLRNTAIWVLIQVLKGLWQLSLCYICFELRQHQCHGHCRRPKAIRNKDNLRNRFCRKNLAGEIRFIVQHPMGIYFGHNRFYSQSVFEYGFTLVNNYQPLPSGLKRIQICIANRLSTDGEPNIHIGRRRHHTTHNFFPNVMVLSVWSWSQFRFGPFWLWRVHVHVAVKYDSWGWGRTQRPFKVSRRSIMSKCLCTGKMN